jgi:uncharacterized damage-inducible protein DinB
MKLRRLFEYDYWANQKVLSAFQLLDEGESRKEIEGVFAHLLAAQAVWISRLKVEKNSIEIWPNLSIAEMKELMNENQKQLKDLVPKKDEIISYTNSKGDRFESKVEDILTHLVIHGQHHRAQMAKQLRSAGITPPGTDFIYFSRRKV